MKVKVFALVALVTALVALGLTGCDNGGALHGCGHNTVTIQDDRGDLICIPRLCEEDEVLGWIGDDLLGCIHIDAFCAPLVVERLQAVGAIGECPNPTLELYGIDCGYK